MTRHQSPQTNHPQSSSSGPDTSCHPTEISPAHAHTHTDTHTHTHTHSHPLQNGSLLLKMKGEYFKCKMNRATIIVAAEAAKRICTLVTETENGKFATQVSLTQRHVETFPCQVSWATVQGSHRTWKTLKTWKTGPDLENLEKIGGFGAKTWKNITKPGKKLTLPQKSPKASTEKVSEKNPTRGRGPKFFFLFLDKGLGIIVFCWNFKNIVLI